MNTTADQRRHIQQLPRQELTALQLDKLNQLLDRILPENQFYYSKIGAKQHTLEKLDELTSLPFTYKEELVDHGGSQFATNLTFPIERYVQFHRTSGTRGRPLIVLDTPDDWSWWLDGWDFVLDAAEVEARDRAVLLFSFGPFIGFWSAHDAVQRRGALVAPAGGMNTLARLELIRTLEATLVFCTPSYALHTAEVALENQIVIGRLPVRKLIVAGEPGGNIPAIREKIESMWEAEVVDHAGATEVGPWGFADPDRRGLLVTESEFIAEFLSVESGQPANEGELAELILTPLGRAGSPIIRYRTGDLVRPVWQHGQPSQFVLLEGGVLGRVDDMMIIRGVNIFPSSIEQILRSFPEIIEYRMTAFKSGAMDGLKIEVEDRLDDPKRVAKELQLRLGLRIDVETVPIGTLPRFELKGNRFIDNRQTNTA